MFTISKKPTISEVHELYKTDKATPSEVFHFFLNRSKDIDKEINAVSNYTENLGLEQAKALDELMKKEGFEKIVDKMPLFGIPFFVKSIIQVEGEETNASSLILKDYKSAYSATPYLKMIEAGSMLLGVVHMDEFASGASGETSAYATAKNPYDNTRIAGGSSSGPVAVVSSGQCVFALGTDTGGSIRQPSAFTNVVGLKPTYGLVSRYGTMPMASSLDQVGPITQNITDNIVVASLLAGKDPKDQTSLESSELVTRLQDMTKPEDTGRSKVHSTKTANPMRIGIPEEFFIDGIEPQIREKLDQLIELLEKQGHSIVKISLPLIKYAISVYYMIMPVELAANLERYDGIRYAKQLGETEELYFGQRNLFGDEIKRRIMLGTYASSAGYYDAYYNHAQKVRYLATEDFKKAFELCDVMLTPTTPEFPFKIGEKSDDPLKMYLSDVFTCGINPVKIPGLNVPLGTFEVADDGKTVNLPSGCQLLAPELCEDRLYKLGKEIEELV